MMRITYVLPVHNEENALADSARAVFERLRISPGSEIVMVENGSTDDSPEIVRQLATELTSSGVTTVDALSAKGFGNAYREGLRLASGDLIVLSAADLPFGFSDLDSYLTLQPRPRLAVGSKAHPSSRVKASMARRLASAVYRTLRWLILGMEVRDSQGTILIEGALARRLLPLLSSSDYFVSTEIIALAGTLGVEPVEVPVDYTCPRSDSKVRVMRDGWLMLRQMIELRRRIRSLADNRTEAAATT